MTNLPTGPDHTPARRSPYADSNPISQTAFTNMRRLRKHHGLSALKLATALTEAGCATSRMTISNQENGYVAHMPLDQAVTLGTLFGVSFDDLCNPQPCKQCDGFPPPGFACTECGKTGRALPTKEWLRDTIAEIENGAKA